MLEEEQGKWGVEKVILDQGGGGWGVEKQEAGKKGRGRGMRGRKNSEYKCEN